MKCRRCGISWKLGNISPRTSSCPICDTNFTDNPEIREFESILEVIQYLIMKNGIEYWKNDKAINGLLNDYFPDKTEIRNMIKHLLELGWGSQMIEWYRTQPSADEIKSKVENVVDNGNSDKIIESISFLIGKIDKEGTNFEDPRFYIDYASSCSDIEMKICALEKAIRHGASDNIELELANMKMAVNVGDGLENLKDLAEKGNMDALLALAKKYEQGKDVIQDFQKEIEYLNKAIESDNAEALYQMGRLYMLGWGVDRTVSKAIELFEKASEQKHAKANYQLYSIYYDGNNAQKRLALEKLQCSAMADHLPSMYEYAIHLLYGENVEENVPMAVSVLEQCALKGYKEAIIKLQFIYSIGYKVSKDKEKALEWQNKLNGGL